MSLKISANMSGVAHHVIDGAFTFPYAIDAKSAVARFPNEWSETPWSAADTAAARREQGAPEVEMTAEERAAIDEHAQAVDAANKRLKSRREKLAAEKAEADQVAADEALVASAPPAPVKRPFGRSGEPTPAELEQIKKREEKKASDERIARDKADQDRLASASAGGAPITG